MVVAAGFAAPALADADCPQPPQELAEVTVTTVQSHVAYRNDLDRKELTHLAGMAAVHEEGILGLTISRYALRSATQNHYTVTTDGRFCLWISGLNATLSIPEMTVYVARNYQPGSCQYEAVLAHEQEHVRRTCELLQPFGQQLRQELARRLAKVMPAVAATPAAADRLASQRVEAVMAEFIDQLERERERTNAIIDSDESYRRTADRCPGW